MISKRRLRELLKDFCTEAYRVLTDKGELPRPPYDSPVIAGNPSLTHWGSQLYTLSSHQDLQTYMRTSGLSNTLRDVGHTFFWHEDVFEWLFLERVIAGSSGTTLSARAFSKVFLRAWAELSRSTFRIRRITALNGLPKLRRPVKLSGNALIMPIDFTSHRYQIANLLGWRFQDRNRAPSFWIGPDDHLLIQDRVVRKGNEGEELFYWREQSQVQTETILRTIRLALETPVVPKAVWGSYLSGFPLLPLSHREYEEYGKQSVSVSKYITGVELRTIRRILSFLDLGEPEISQTPSYFRTAVERFSNSFRHTQLEQSIVDLIVALEAMFGVRDEELKRRLATHVAIVFGVNDRSRETLYRQVSAGYRLRNTVVHGGRNQVAEMSAALKHFFPELAGQPSDAILRHLGRAVDKLQQIVRSALRAYIHLKTNSPEAEWPNTKDLENLPFNSGRQRLVQRQLGVKRAR